MSRDEDQAESQRQAVDRLGFPADFVSFLDQRSAADRVGHALSAGGLFFSQSGWANPAAICTELMTKAGDRLDCLFGSSASHLTRGPEGWQVFDANQQLLAAAPVVIFASGHEAGKLLPAPGVPLQAIRGQISYLAAGEIPAIQSVLCGDGYATPAVNGIHCIGASYDLDDDPNPRLDCHQDNLLRLERLLPGATLQLDPRQVRGRVSFRAVAPDRLPLVGALPDWNPNLHTAGASNNRPTQLNQLPRHDGLFCLLGYASRGLTWASLMAETLAASLEGEPSPIETDLLDAIDPGRFLLRELRREQR